MDMLPSHADDHSTCYIRPGRLYYSNTDDKVNLSPVESVVCVLLITVMLHSAGS